MTTGRRTMRASAPQSVTFVELFCDLVFVFAVTQVTVLTAHDLTPAGIVRSVLIFWLIWWGWTQFTWTLNPADTTHAAVRLITLVATGAAFVMATTVAGAFGADGRWFAGTYVVVRALGLGLQVRIDLHHPEADHVGVRRWVSFSVIGLAIVLVGGLADPAIRPWLWSLTIVADLVAASIAGRAATWDLNPAHVAAFGIGIALFVTSSALSWWRLSGRIVVGRLAVLAAMAVALAAVAPLKPVWPLAAVAAALLTIIVIETARPPQAIEHA